MSHIEVLWRPLLTPAAFFSDLTGYLSKMSPGLLLVVWGTVTAAIQFAIFGTGVDVSKVGSGFPPALVSVAAGIVGSLGNGLFALLVSFLPAVLLHLLCFLLIQGYKDNLLATWRIVAFLSVPLVALNSLLSGLREIPGVGSALFVGAGAILLILLVNALRSALVVLYDAGQVRASSVALVSLSPLALLVVASAYLILR